MRDVFELGATDDFEPVTNVAHTLLMCIVFFTEQNQTVEEQFERQPCDGASRIDKQRKGTTQSLMKATQPILKESDAAMSLCALGRMGLNFPQDAVYESEPNPAQVAADQYAAVPQSSVAFAHLKPMEVNNLSNPPLNLTGMNLHLDSKFHLCDHGQTLYFQPNPVRAGGQKSRVAPAKYNMKPKDPKRDTSVPFDEMKRLMRVYGPIKCLRNRTPKDSGRSTKTESIKRKFYRWFPDFEERFEKTPDGWYKPKLGHEHEMLYREEMRKKDQELLVKKRNSKRCNAKLIDVPPPL